MASLSLTPRETTSGLRRPRQAAPPKVVPSGAPGLPKKGFLPDAPGATPSPRRMGSARSDDSEPPPIPTREELRYSTRQLHQRKLSKFAAADNVMDSISEVIRERTTLTLKQAFAQPDAANINAAREAQLQSQRARVEDLRRAYDLLHADLVGKEQLVRMAELTYATDSLAEEPALVPMPPPGPPPDAPARKTKAGKSDGRRIGTSDSHRSSLQSGGPPDVDPAEFEQYALGDGAAARKQPEVLRVDIGPPIGHSNTQVELDDISARVEEASAELSAMQHHCEVLAHIEHRTRTANNKVGAEVDGLRAMMTTLLKDEETIREFEEDAQKSVRKARKELADAKAAHADQQRSYEDCKYQRGVINEEKKAQVRREHEFIEGEISAKLDGIGELDAAGEEQLKSQIDVIEGTHLTAQMQKDAVHSEETRMFEVFQKLRRATHDPESISTPQELYVTMVTAKDRTAELEEQVAQREELQQELGEDKDKARNELHQLMYFGSTSQALVEAESELQPKLDSASNLLTYRSSKFNDTRHLIQECKVGLSLLMNLTIGESLQKLISDAEVGVALERVERHLQSCLMGINAANTPQVGRGGRAAAQAVAEQAAAADAAAVVEARTAAAEAEAEAAEAAAEAQAAAAAAAAAAEVEAAAPAPAEGDEGAAAPGQGGDSSAKVAAEKAAAAEERAAAAAQAAAAAAQAVEAAEAAASARPTSAGTASASSPGGGGGGGGGAKGSSSSRSKAIDVHEAQQVGAALLSARFVNNCRIVTEEEIEEQLGALLEPDDGDDDDGEELELTRRTRKKQAVDAERKKKSGVSSKPKGKSAVSSGRPSSGRPQRA